MKAAPAIIQLVLQFLKSFTFNFNSTNKYEIVQVIIQNIPLIALR